MWRDLRRYAKQKPRGRYRVDLGSQLLKTTLVNRKGRWKLFQRAITARARVQFMWMLSERSFRGRLLANHKEKKLDLVVSIDLADSGGWRITEKLYYLG